MKDQMQNQETKPATFEDLGYSANQIEQLEMAVAESRASGSSVSIQGFCTTLPWRKDEAAQPE